MLTKFHYYYSHIFIHILGFLLTFCSRGFRYAMIMICNSQPKLLGTENMAAAYCYKKRKSLWSSYQLYISDAKDMKKDNKILRAVMLKKRYADVIFKSQQQVLGEAFVGMRWRRKLGCGRSNFKKRKPTSSGKEIEKQLGSPSKALKGPLILVMVFKSKEICWPSSVLRVVGERVYIFYVVLLLGF